MTYRTMWQVTQEIRGAHPRHNFYPLLPGDLVVRDDDGTWTKECPGLTVCGFILSDDQQSTLVERRVYNRGLIYNVEKENDSDQV